MATVIGALAIGGAASGSAIAAGTVGAFLITAGAAIIDSQIIMPALAGSPDDERRPSRLADVPVGSNDAGAPRIWACGQRVRIPTHVVWQDDKVLEGSTSTGNFLKKGADIPWRRTYFDCALALNDRKTEQVVQLIGNGKLLVWEERNTVYVRTATMSIEPGGGGIILSVGDLLDPDFSDKFVVGDTVQLRDFNSTAGGDPNEGWWAVDSVLPHTQQPSQMTLVARTGQIAAGMYASSGQFPQSSVSRADDVVLTDQTAAWSNTYGTPPGQFQFPSVEAYLPTDQVNRTLAVGSVCELGGWGSPGNEFLPGVLWKIFDISQFYSPAMGAMPSNHLRVAFRLHSGISPLLAYTLISVIDNAGPAYHWGSVKPQGNVGLGFFPTSFVPKDHFLPGDDAQEPLPMMVDRLGPSNASAFRGVAVQGIDQFFVNDFGNQLPFSMEALIDVDISMTWPQAFEAVCLDRAGIASSSIDTTGVEAKPFDGFYIRGGGGAGVAMQPLLVAGRVVTQERNGIIAFFEVKNADVVQIENGATLSHLGARLAKDAENDTKVTRTEAALQDLSTSVSVRHQDPDNNYADGLQYFGLRAPAGVDHLKETPVNLNTMVLSRRKARDLAASLLRREWINSVRYSLVLPICYYHLLENDIVTFTDDDGVDIIARIVRREVGANFLVVLECVEEVIDIDVVGSSVQPLSLSGPQFPMPMPTEGKIYALQLPALNDDESTGPGVYLAAVQNSPRWAPVTIYGSDDGVGDWRPVANRVEPSISGAIVQGWPADPTAFPEGSRWAKGVPNEDELSLGAVDIEIPFGSLLSATADEVDRGANWAAVFDIVSGEWEIVGFTDAVPAATAGVWTINVVRRGLRGSWPASMNIKPAGAVFVLLSTTEFHSLAGNRSPSSMSYRSVYGNGIINEGPAVGVAIRNINSTPGPVRSITRANNSPSTGDITFTIDLRGLRTNEVETDLADSPMRETGEKFVVELYDPSGVRILRRKTLNFEGSGLALLRDRKVTYTAAEQTADNYRPAADAVYIAVRQIGEYGQGASARVLIS